MPARVVLILSALAVVFLSLASPSGASEQFGDRDVSFKSLKVNDRSEALVTYRTSRGVLRRVYVWGNGERRRVTVIGPGVTPVVQWEGPAIGRYDLQQDRQFDALFDRIVGSADRVCIPER